MTLISHRYKFIFIKTTKTAGTSIEVDLSKLLGSSDIVTPIYPEVEGHSPRNHEQRKIFGLKKTRFYNHMPATEVRKKVGQKIFSSYFKFCVEREPVDKCISHFSMLKRSQEHNSGNAQLTWDQYLEKRDFPVDTSKYTDVDGSLLVDTIVPYERLDELLTTYCRKLGINLEGLSTKAKSGFRIDIPISEQQRRTIYTAFESSNRFTGYNLLTGV